MENEPFSLYSDDHQLQIRSLIVASLGKKDTYPTSALKSVFVDIVGDYEILSKDEEEEMKHTIANVQKSKNVKF